MRSIYFTRRLSQDTVEVLDICGYNINMVHAFYYRQAIAFFGRAGLAAP
jgi:hypothetical protein